MRRKIAALSLTALLLSVVFAPNAEACGKCHGKSRGGQYVTYNGANFQTYPLSYGVAPTAYQQPRARMFPRNAPMYPQTMPYAPAAPGGGFPAPPPPMMGY